jgi:uracil-DNA glycosylase family 4
MQKEELDKEILQCQLCPFQEYSFNKTKELGFGAQYRIMFIGLAPSISSNKSAGNSTFDHFFSSLLSKVELSAKDYYFTNLVKTAIPKDHSLTTEQIEHCNSHLEKEVLLVKPQVIVLLGRDTRQAFGFRYPAEKGFRVFKNNNESHRVKIYTMSHPAILYYHPEQEVRYLKALKKCIKDYKLILI